MITRLQDWAAVKFASVGIVFSDVTTRLVGVGRIALEEDVYQ
jgi:hypothetical protein